MAIILCESTREQDYQDADETLEFNIQGEYFQKGNDNGLPNAELRCTRGDESKRDHNLHNFAVGHDAKSSRVSELIEVNDWRNWKVASARLHSHPVQKEVVMGSRGFECAIKVFETL